MKPFYSTDKFIAIAAFICAASLVSCESDLLGKPPSAVSITLVAEPTVTADSDSAALLCTTSQNATVAIEYGTVSGEYTHASVRTSAESTDHSVSLTNLNTLTTYYYRVVSWLEGSRSFNSDEYQFQTASIPAVVEEEPTAAQKARGIWVIGGLSGALISSVVTTIDLFDPMPTIEHTEGQWFPSAASTTGYTPVSFAGVAAYDGKLYVIGGYDATGVAQNSVQIYDIATYAWSNGATMPTARANINASVLNGKIYVLSGSRANADVTWATAPLPGGVCYEYTPGAPGSWDTKANYTATNNTERFSYVFGNTLYSLGGRSSATALTAPVHDGFIPSLQALTTGTTELAMATAPSVARTGISGVVSTSDYYDPALVVVGGISAIAATTGNFINSPSSASGTFQSLVLYLAYPFAAPAAWQQNANAAFTIAFGTAVFTKASGTNRIYYLGGTSTLGSSPSVSVSVRWIEPPRPPNAWTDNWNPLTTVNMSPGRWGHGAVTLNE